MSYLSEIEKINKLAKSLKDTGIAANMEDAVQMAESILKRSKSPEERHAEISRIPAEEKKGVVESEINELTEENRAAEAEEQNRADDEKEYVPEESPSEEVRKEETTEDVMREERIIDEAIASQSATAESSSQATHEDNQEVKEENENNSGEVSESGAEVQTEELPARHSVATTQEAAPEKTEDSTLQEESRPGETGEDADESRTESQEAERVEQEQERRKEGEGAGQPAEKKTDEEEISDEQVPKPSEELMKEYNETEHPSEKIDEPVGDSTIFSEYKAEQKQENNEGKAKSPDAPDYDISQEDKTLAELMAEDAAAIYGTPEEKESENARAEGSDGEGHNENSAEDDSGEGAVEEFTREIPVDREKERPTLTEKEKKETDLSRIFNFSNRK